jgi:hypothetical protein
MLSQPRLYYLLYDCRLCFTTYFTTADFVRDVPEPLSGGFCFATCFTTALLHALRLQAWFATCPGDSQPVLYATVLQSHALLPTILPGGQPACNCRMLYYLLYYGSYRLAVPRYCTAVDAAACFTTYYTTAHESSGFVRVSSSRLSPLPTLLLPTLRLQALLASFVLSPSPLARTNL